MAAQPSGPGMQEGFSGAERKGTRRRSHKGPMPTDGQEYSSCRKLNSAKDPNELGRGFSGPPVGPQPGCHYDVSGEDQPSPGILTNRLWARVGAI